ncbi:hypothetical protein [Pseudonocardia yunnanensis]|uniref:hypothetical protein n=1 Tax=Pseudonocardia yunnanensis TaxID=58107 RepID=UPI0036D30171
MLFIGAAYDPVADVVTTDAAEPMRRWCSDITEVTIAAGRWVALEQPEKVDAVLAHWLATRVGDFWPTYPAAPIWPRAAHSQQRVSRSAD